MKRGIRDNWPWLAGLLLALTCLSCQPTLGTKPPSPPPPPRAVPEPLQRPVFYVKVSTLNLRAGPGMDFPKISHLNRNEELEKVGEVDDWFQVRVKRDGTLGWVSSQYLSDKPVDTSASERPTPAPPKDAPATELKHPKPSKVETVLPQSPKPAEAAEPPAPKTKRGEEPAPEPRPAKPEPQPVEPTTPTAPAPPEEKSQRIRIM